MIRTILVQLQDSLTILPGNATVNLSNLEQTYSGTVKSATITTTPPDLNFSVTYNNTPKNAGSYIVTVAVIDPNYTGGAAGTLVINKATAYVVAANKVIKKGDPQPAFTSTFSGFVNGETHQWLHL